MSERVELYHARCSPGEPGLDMAQAFHCVCRLCSCTSATCCCQSNTHASHCLGKLLALSGLAMRLSPRLFQRYALPDLTMIKSNVTNAACTELLQMVWSCHLSICRGAAKQRCAFTSTKTLASFFALTSGTVQIIKVNTDVCCLA